MALPLLADAYVHDLDPIVFTISGNLAVRWYGLAYLAGFIIAFVLMHWMARTKRIALKPQHVWDFVTYMIIGVLVGGRVGHALFYAAGEPLYTFTHAFPYWELLAVHRGGMASHGGMIGVIIACGVFAWRHRPLPMLHLFDFAAYVSCPGWFFGRLANFVNGELFGRACSGDLAWAVKFPQEIERWILDRDVVKLESLNKVVEQLDINFLSWQAAIHNLGDPQARKFALDRASEIAAATHSDQAHTMLPMLDPLLTARHPSQIYQAITDGVVLMALLTIIWLKPRRPGVIAAWYLMLYGILRIAMEFYRLPDAGVSLFLNTLSRGQALSMFMIIGGLALLIYCARRPVDRMGGLWSRQAE